MVTVVHQMGQSAVKVHSSSGVIRMTPDEQREWVRHELKNKHTIPKQIHDFLCYIYGTKDDS